MPSRRDMETLSDKDGDDAPSAHDEEEDEADEPEEDEDGGAVVEKTGRGAGHAARRSHARPAGRTRYQQFKARFRDVRLPVYTAFFAAALFTAAVGIFAVWMKRALGPWFEARFNEFGAWNTWLFLAGILLIMVATYLFLALVYKKREFQRLVSTKSKGDFVHSLDRIERLAFELGTRENEIVAARKRDFRIRH